MVNFDSDPNREFKQIMKHEAALDPRIFDVSHWRLQNLMGDEAVAEYFHTGDVAGYYALAPEDMAEVMELREMYREEGLL